ncbi:hypothetical protein H0H93_011178 [Arthromyces matolae]|nr:hypothetical protein H0H93_011178 [Arthromyces matolae]
MSDAIQVVDFSPFLNGTDKQATAESIFKSFKDTGFVYLVNHGLPSHEIESMFSWSKKFFSLSHEEKMLAALSVSKSYRRRGYAFPGLTKVTQHIYDDEELAKRRAIPDVKEHFAVGLEDVEPNVWFPDHVLPGFKEACLNFYWKMYDLEKSILRALAIGFNLPEDALTKVHAGPHSLLHLIHYPSVSLEALQTNEVSRIDAHSDFGSITLLIQDNVGGLEVEDPVHPGLFRPVNPIPGSIIVNSGDLLMRWSNDTIPSTIHRVRAPLNNTNSDGMVPERYSIPYDPSTIIDALPGTWSAEHPKKYEPILLRVGPMSGLPPDVWALVAQHLDPLEIASLISLNSAFLNIALDIRYRTIEWGLLNAQLTKTLARLQDPYIGKRVRKLCLRPWFLQYLFERELLFQQSAKAQQLEEAEPTWRNTFKQLSNYFYTPEASRNDPFARPPGFTEYPAPHELINSMTKAVEGMTNVTEYEFQWRDMPVNPGTLSFLSSLRAAFQANLRKLVLHTRISKFNQLLSFSNFHWLEELELHFEYDPTTDTDAIAENVDVLVHTMAPFINRLQGTLRTLTISSVADADHSPFFRTLGPLPNLRTFALRMSFNTSSPLSDPVALNSFLLRHKSFLTTLIVEPTYDKGMSEALAAWQPTSRACTSDSSWLSNLDSLTFPAIHMPDINLLLRRAPDQLRSLRLLGRFLDGPEVATVIACLSGRGSLATLSLNVKMLNSELFTLLANTLPALRSLMLVVHTPLACFLL